MKKINVKNKKEFEAIVKELRVKGFMIITFTKRFAELENDSEMIAIEY